MIGTEPFDLSGNTAPRRQHMYGDWRNITESVMQKIDTQHRILIWRHNHVRACLTIVKTSLLQLNYQNIVDSVHLENEFLEMKMDKNITICLICKNNTKSS